MAQNLHEALIADLLANPVTPRDHAAVAEILNLRAQLGGAGAGSYQSIEGAEGMEFAPSPIQILETLSGGGADLTRREGEGIIVEEAFTAGPITGQDIEQAEEDLGPIIPEEKPQKKAGRDSGRRGE